MKLVETKHDNFTHIQLVPEFNEVYCDMCGDDYTHSDKIGGFLFGSKACCPVCQSAMIPDIKKYDEEYLIRDIASDGETFNQFVMRLRENRP